MEFRYTLRTHGGFNEEEAERFGKEEARPLVYRVLPPSPPNGEDQEIP